MSILSRMKKFIKHFKHNLKVYKDKLLSIHVFLGTTTETSMYRDWKTTDRSLYLMFFGWLLENIILIGSMITMFVKVLFNYHQGFYTILMPIVYGCLYWFILDTIKKISKVIRSKE